MAHRHLPPPLLVTILIGIVTMILEEDRLVDMMTEREIEERMITKEVIEREDISCNKGSFFH